ncbi:MAG: TonB-dependent receptor plug domain-containing protein [Candidatus Didemnitutus sp.]|nr:TonB-dependent receptor plug domain-containing protein [Candidatus Didemnitutus sp.]
MHPKLNPIRDAGFKSCLAALLIASTPSFAQAQAAATDNTAAPAATKNEEEAIQLSPFTVTTDKDKGYRATNTTSGTRLNTAIKDLPMPIEVITEQFIRDTGSKDLRETLRYSAGIQLQSQNDWGTTQGWAATTPGRINNPEGSTATADQSRVKIRGFLTEASLRDGFRRQNSTDSVNLARVEVIRGPSSLLYGVGNFGGVVNYLVKQPSKKSGGDVSLEVGSWGLIRGTIDYTGPVSDTVDYRLTAAYQRTDDYTDYKKENHYFVAPIVTWQPFKDTKITFDTEFGKQNRSGIGFQNIRAVPTGFVNSSDGYNGGFLTPAGRNPKEFRWSGPDTFNDSKAWNLLFKLEQKLAENLYFNLGYNNSKFSYDQLDVSASLQTPGTSTPAWAIANIVYVPLVAGQSGFPTGSQPATIGYQWNASTEDDKHEQIRADLTYKLDLFETSKWFKLENTFLAGLNYTSESYENVIRGTPYDRNMFKSPADSGPFRAGKQADGSADYAMVDLFHQIQKTKDSALYAVYQGKLLDEWVTLIAGVRKDRSWNKFWHYNPQWGAGNVGHNQGYDEKPVEQYGEPSKDTTYQYGIDVRLTRSGSLSLYAMKAESSLPNYDGAKDFYGNVIKAALGEDKEVGLKFDLWNGRVSGTISKFQITRTRVGIGNPGAIWWAPTASGTSYFNPSKNIVYQANDLNPTNNGWNAAVVASTAQWNAAVAAGAAYQATNSAGNTNWYVNASAPTGAALMDAVFANAISTNSTGWWGWIYNFDNLTNNATVDYNGASPPGPTGGRSVPLGSDRSEGWDAQVLLSPTDNLQIALSYSHVDKTVLNASAWAKYPYPQDRWAIWYAPIDWADGGTAASKRFTDPTDTSTHISFGNGLTLDDTPKSQSSAWVNYQFPKASAFKGFSLGAGVVHTGSGVIYPTYFSQPKDANGNVIFLNSKAKTVWNGMARYEFKIRGHDASLQLNIDNLTNNTDYYGFIAQAPRRFSLTYSQKL